jgi:glycosyltransferase involved in cell wall biosynthesis
MVTLERVRGEPQVSVIVPARDEEASLGRCLASIVAQTGTTFEVIVVDDGSTDRTREIALSFAGVCVIDPPPLTAGWTGKNNAVVAGARHARGRWLLFTDADTEHLPGSLARSVAEIQERGAALLSYSPAQDVHGFWQHAVMPVIFAELAATYSPSQVSDPACPVAAANGQYLLVTREVYDTVGGHVAVAHDLLEDVALARRVKQSGRKIFFRYGDDAVRTRMYRSFEQMREGWTKNLALLFPSPRRLAVLRATEFVMILGGLALAGGALARKMPSFALISAGVAGVFYLVFLTRIRKAHFSALADMLAIFGLPLFSYLLWLSQLCYRQGQVAWKGRTYAQGSRA